MTVHHTQCSYRFVLRTLRHCHGDAVALAVVLANQNGRPHRLGQLMDMNIGAIAINVTLHVAMLCTGLIIQQTAELELFFETMRGKGKAQLAEAFSLFVEEASIPFPWLDHCLARILADMEGIAEQAALTVSTTAPLLKEMGEYMEFLASSAPVPGAEPIQQNLHSILESRPSPSLAARLRELVVAMPDNFDHLRIRLDRLGSSVDDLTTNLRALDETERPLDEKIKAAAAARPDNTTAHLRRYMADLQSVAESAGKLKQSERELSTSLTAVSLALERLCGRITRTSCPKSR